MRVVKAFAILKRSTALANKRLGNLDAEKAEAIAAVCDDVLKASTMTTSRLSYGRPEAAHKAI
ncbi:hypothetical protein [Bacillus subtilis]|uniref:hypothetical protein n=1 Tax=Bacillus subtilis TaxID=1423 RepID=UPI003D1FF499